MEDRIDAICDLLLGAAHADDEFHDREMEVILELLAKLLKVDEVPAEIAAKLNTFDSEGFDVEATAAVFKDQDEEHKIKLLELISVVHEADDEYAFSEDDYIRRVGLAIDLEAAKIESMALEFEVEELQQSLDELRSGS